MQISVKKYGESIGKSRYTIYRMIQKNKLPKGVKVKDIAGRKVIEVKD